MVLLFSRHIHVTYYSKICHRKHGGAHPPRTCAQLTNIRGEIMRHRMQRNLHTRTGHGFEERKMCNVRIPRSEIALVESRIETEI
jgi:hypothetical protein